MESRPSSFTNQDLLDFKRLVEKESAKIFEDSIAGVDVKPHIATAFTLFQTHLSSKLGNKRGASSRLSV